MLTLLKIISNILTATAIGSIGATTTLAHTTDPETAEHERAVANAVSHCAFAWKERPQNIRLCLLKNSDTIEVEMIVCLDGGGFLDERGLEYPYYVQTYKGKTGNKIGYPANSCHLSVLTDGQITDNFEN